MKCCIEAEQRDGTSFKITPWTTADGDEQTEGEYRKTTRQL